MRAFSFQPSLSPLAITSSDLQTLGAAQFGHADARELLSGNWSNRGTAVRLLLLFQSVNAGGKDGAIEEVVSLLGEECVRVERFRRPPDGEPEIDLVDFASRLAPVDGELVVFNRSYYEAPLRAAIEQQPTLAALCERIITFENGLSEAGIAIVKLFLHIDKDVQLRRLDDRQKRPELRRLHNPRDYGDQAQWHDLMAAYDLVMSRTHTTRNPWLVIPSNDRHVRNTAVQQVLASVLEMAR